ncbi:MAG: hypothetical protein FJZ01_06120 [Candidatus Sericytochromatia bacterium]|nr:hypothetical protein [Candidatus Tanganyikabacteria bacterium]
MSNTQPSVTPSGAPRRRAPRTPLRAPQAPSGDLPVRPAPDRVAFGNGSPGPAAPGGATLAANRPGGPVQGAAPLSGSRGSHVARALARGVLHAPAGTWHTLRDMGKAVLDHPLLTGAILAGSIGLTAAVPAAAPVMVGIGAVLAGVSVGVKTQRAVSTAWDARTQKDLDRAARLAGDAYGDALVNGALFALPYAAGRIAQARGHRFMTRAISQAQAETPAGAPKGDASLAKVLEFVENTMKAPPDDLARDAARTFQALPRGTRKQLMRMVVDQEFLSGSASDRAAQLLDALGPGFTKLAQVYSEADGVPPAVARALKVSRDAMKPMPQGTLHDVLSRHGTQDLGDMLRGIYKIGDGRYRLEKLLGVASIGEVHLARDVESGAQVVLKVRKVAANPRAVEREFRLMRELVEVGAKHGRLSAEQLDLAKGNLESFRRGVLAELDFGSEAKAARRFAQLYKEAGFDGVTVRHVSKGGDLLVMDVAQGVPFTKLDTLPAAQRQEAHLAYLRAMLRQVFDGYFHADPHAGNVFWNPATRRIQFIDMGAMGETGVKQQLELAELLLTSLSRNPDAIAANMIRTAEKITSPLPRAKLQAALGDEVAAFLARYGRAGDLNRQSMDLMRAAQRLGVWPRDNGFWFNKTMFTVVTTVDKPTQELFMAEALPKLAVAVARTAVSEPAETARMLSRVALAARRNPGEFMAALVVQSKAQPQMLGNLPKWAVRASNEFALPGRALSLDITGD